MAAAGVFFHVAVHSLLHLFGEGLACQLVDLGDCGHIVCHELVEHYVY